MSEDRKERKSNPNHLRTVYLINVIFLCLLTLAVLAGAVILFLRYRETRKELSLIHQEMTATTEHAKTLYTDQEVERLVQNASQESSEEARRKLLQEMQSSLETGKSVLTTLRTLYPDNFVVSADDQYYFYPILKNVRTNPFDSADFAPGDDGRMAYRGDNGDVKTRFGIDISSATGTIDWEAAAEDGVQFAMIRVGGRDQDGTLFLDDRFLTNVTEAQKAGIRTGVYMRLNCITDEEAEADAAFLLDTLHDLAQPVDGPVAAVITAPSRDSRAYGQSRAAWTSHAKTFLDTLNKGSQKGMLYSNAAGYAMMLDLGQFEDTDKWIADRSGSLYFPYRFTCWQYGAGKVKGIDGKVNCDLLVLQE